MIQFDSYVSNGLKFHQLGMLNTELHTMDVMNTSLPQDEIRQCFEGFELAEAIFGTMGTRLFDGPPYSPKCGGMIWNHAENPWVLLWWWWSSQLPLDASIYWQQISEVIDGVGASKRNNTSFARLLGTRGAFGGKDKQRSGNELLRWFQLGWVIWSY